MGKTPFVTEIQNGTRTEVAFRMLPLAQEDYQCIGAALSSPQCQLTTLEIDACGLEDLGAAAISEPLAQCRTLCTVILTQHQMSVAGMRAVAEGAAGSRSLQQFNNFPVGALREGKQTELALIEQPRKLHKYIPA